MAGRRIEAQFIEGQNAGAPVLVFLHEGLGSLALWKRFPRDLAALTGCGALVYSRYGNGFSEVLAADRSASYMHDEGTGALDSLLDRFDVRKAVLVGHSDGASIALIHAGQTPERVSALVALAPHTFVEDVSVASIARAKVLYERGALRERLARYHCDVDRTFYGWNDIWLSDRFRAWNIRKYVRCIDAPMFVVQGALDEYGTHAQLDAIASDAQGPVDTLYLANCGHAPHRDRAGLVLAAIAAFVKSATAP